MSGLSAIFFETNELKIGDNVNQINFDTDFTKVSLTLK